MKEVNLQILSTACCLVQVSERSQRAVVSRSELPRSSWTVRMLTPLRMR